MDSEEHSPPWAGPTPTVDGGRDGRRAPPPAARAAGEPLQHRTVRETEGPDRYTVFPRDVAGVPRMSTWLTVNVSCVVDLEEWR